MTLRSKAESAQKAITSLDSPVGLVVARERSPIRRRERSARTYRTEGRAVRLAGAMVRIGVFGMFEFELEGSVVRAGCR